MDQRLKLHQILVDLLGSKNVYFQPPSNVKMSYPCIVYQREVIDSRYADDLAYHSQVRYQVTHISRDPDADIIFEIMKLPYVKHTRFFVSDNLNHDVFTLYF